uniref:Uncharacterized protein n=1 Tax=Arundo donax TaxID=35708 RepID=A0A0A9ECB2_ARUDO
MLQMSLFSVILMKRMIRWFAHQLSMTILVQMTTIFLSQLMVLDILKDTRRMLALARVVLVY